MKFAYARTGGPLLDWSGPTPPYQSRAGETRSLGSLGEFYPTVASSNALRRYGGRSAGHRGAAVGYQHNRALGSLGHDDVPRPGAPEIIGGYEAPEPGAGIIHIGADEPTEPKKFDTALIRRAAALAAAYHGVKRHNGSVLWGLLWGAAAFIAPVNGLTVVAIGVAQGFAKPK